MVATLTTDWPRDPAVSRGFVDLDQCGGWRAWQKKLTLGSIRVRLEELAEPSYCAWRPKTS